MQDKIARSANRSYIKTIKDCVELAQSNLMDVFFMQLDKETKAKLDELDQSLKEARSLVGDIGADLFVEACTRKEIK